ncbi:MAG: amino acid permease [Candidatus Latescibacteria bacterium]|nr:amino acid permease [Candidatus Latescibacterota bacterium]
MDAKHTLVRGLGPVSATALIVGNMIGTGIYTLPASLALTAGPISLVSWLLTATGYLFLAIIYADMGTAYPRSGGPYVYARRAFGSFVGFEVVYSYWLSNVIGNAAIVIATVGYMGVFNQRLADSPALQVLVAQGVLWALTGINIVGVREGAAVQVMTTVAKTIPLLILSGVAIWRFNPGHLTPFAPHGVNAISSGAALTVWAFAGVESATVPAEEVAAPQTTIRRSTLWGFGIATGVYMLVSLAVIGVLPNDDIAASVSPLARAAAQVFGPWGETLMAASALLAGRGVLNGWILLTGRIPISAAGDGLFPAPLARIHARFRTPHVSLLVSTAVTGVFLMLRLSRSLIEAFDFIILLSVLLTLLPHLTTVVAELRLAEREPESFPVRRHGLTRAITIVGLVFVLWIVYGTGVEAIWWGSVLLVAGIPIYGWLIKTGVRDQGSGVSEDQEPSSARH